MTIRTRNEMTIKVKVRNLQRMSLSDVREPLKRALYPAEVLVTWIEKPRKATWQAVTVLDKPEKNFGRSKKVFVGQMTGRDDE